MSSGFPNKHWPSSVLVLFSFLWMIPLLAQEPDFVKLSLPDSVTVVNDIFKSNKEEVILATNVGVYRYFAGIDQFELLYSSKDIGQLKINVVAQSKTDAFFLGTYRSSIILFTPNEGITEFSFLEMVGLEALVTDINCIDSILYIGTSEGNILKFDISTQKFELHSSPVKAEINAIWKEENNALWISSINGVYSYKNNAWTQLNEFFQAYGLRIKQDEYWVIGRDAEFNAKIMYLYNYQTELFNMRKQKWATLVLKNLPNNFARFNDIDFDSQGLIWLASNIGVLKYDPFTGYSIWYSKEKYQNFELNETMRVLVIDDNNILVSYQNKLMRLGFPIE